MRTCGNFKWLRALLTVFLTIKLHYVFYDCDSLKRRPICAICTIWIRLGISVYSFYDLWERAWMAHFHSLTFGHIVPLENSSILRKTQIQSGAFSGAPMWIQVLKIISYRITSPQSSTSSFFWFCFSSVFFFAFCWQYLPLFSFSYGKNLDIL